MQKLQLPHWFMLILCTWTFTYCGKYCTDETNKSFRLWATADAHVQGGLKDFGRESLAEAIEQSEFGGRGGGPSFEWDVMLHLGDLVGKSAPPNDQDGIVEGVDMTLKQVLDILEKHNVKPIDSVGNPFDPRYHEAFLQEASDEHPDNIVIRELQRGYMLHDRLLRPAVVAVSKSKESGCDEAE